MLPIVMAQHIHDGLADYLETTFPMTNRPFKGSMRALAQRQDALALDPFVSVRLPFRTAPDNEPFPFAECLHPVYRPYAHQMKAFRRISDGKSTLVATGTGSGKTECFLYPILDYCYQQNTRHGRRGIKAILVYPMNALASDQAKRLAALIHGSPELNGNVTAGMYVGAQSLGAKHSSKRMTEDSIITDHDELLNNPPDILLTNYKMLDYLLIRPEDSRLWRDNDEQTLKYFVVDELHTFDGAQGTDLACLLRRLIDRLRIEPGHLCCVGTSATMGTDDTVDAVCAYASSIFNTTFTPDAVVTEDRLDAHEFFTADTGNTGDGTDHADEFVYDDTVPSPDQADRLGELESGVSPVAYLQQATESWLETSSLGNADEDTNHPKFRLALGRALKRSRFLASLCDRIGSRPHAIDKELGDALCSLHARFALLDTSQRRAALDALIALVSYARSGSIDHPRPFLDVQVQLWTKELRRLTASIVPLDGEVHYQPALELDEQGLDHQLPVINCRDCGGTGWIGLAGKDDRINAANMKAFYNTYFAFQTNNPFLVMQPCATDVTGNADMAVEWFCPQCMRGQLVEHFTADEQACPECGAARIAMTVRGLETVATGRKHYRCPFCGSDRSIALVGLRSTPQIAVMLSQLSADAFNDDDKTIVFSDSVQDASFRASAFNAHTWRFALRNSAMDYITQAGMDDATLGEYLDGQAEYYHRRYPDESDYAVRFIAPNMTWMREYESLLDGNPAGPERKTLIDLIDRRLRLESLLEFGLQSRTGRTLAKSGCAALYFSPQRVGEAAERFRERCINELGIDDGVIRPDDWGRLIMGFLDLMRSSGAFFDKSYDRYLHDDANRIMLSNNKNTGIWWMPGSFFDVLPRFLASTPQGKQKDSYDTLDTPSYRRLATRYLTDSSLVGNIDHQLLEYVLEACVDAGFVTRRDIPGRFGQKAVYGLDETACHIGTHVVQLVCDVCGRGVSCEQRNLNMWDGSRCATDKCPGHLRLDDDATSTHELSYYGQLYRAKPAERIRAAEHTSLLSGDDRTKLEQQFKSQQHIPGEVNVLTCTPTLEMGIDIGDLSTVILASMPPAQAQYLQRAGRAGRRDGNSLVLAVANSRPHDLYFYQRPLDMIGGDVNPPHIFLEATAVLERQFIAYTMDRWVHEMLECNVKPADIIPTQLKACLMNVRDLRTNAFPFTLIDYVKNNATDLLDGFRNLFTSAGDDTASDSRAYDVRDQLSPFVYGGKDHADAERGKDPLTVRLLDVFRSANETIDEFSRQRAQIEDIVKDLEGNPADPSYEQRKRECRNEINGIDKTIRHLNRLNTFNYLSDQGILPNYAFPETGVTLHTVLKADAPATDGTTDAASTTARRKHPELETGDFVRPAASAITELAPGNTFYANGRKYEINRILFSKGDMDEDAVMWRLCPNCSHAEPASNIANLASCPSCGSTQWADAGQLRSMLRIDTVISEERYSESLVDGSGDQRVNTFFVRDALIDIDRDDVTSAWKIDKGHTDFAFEYVPHGTVREINFGKAGTDGSEMEVAGDKQVRTGFTVCTRCGALANDKGYIAHSYACPNRIGTREPLLHSDEETKCLFLFRDLNTEMLRILVPGIADSTGNGKDAESFTAAVMLGMRRKFGDVSHLAVTLSNEPLRDGSGLRKTYLVIYDTVPGGTGYLKQLAESSDAFIDVLSLAAQAMDGCTCEDGCYRCLYSYRQSRDIRKISKDVARSLIETILEDRGHLVETATIADVSVNNLLDSRLEEQFLEALRRLHADPLAKDAQERGRRATMRKDVINGKDGYVLTIADSTWTVELQADGSRLARTPVILSKPDFLLHCISDDQNVSVTDPDAAVVPRRRDVAVFTDGLRFHAGIVADDTAKREALRRAGYRVWSLDYDDVARFLDDPDDSRLYDPALDVNSMPGKKNYRGLVDASHASELDPGKTSAMAMLAYYLTQPDAERLFAAQAEGLGVAMVSGKLFTRDPEVPTLMERMEESLTGTHDDYLKHAVFTFSGASRLRLQTGLLLTDNGQKVVNHNDLLFDDTIAGYHAETASDDDDPLLLLDEEDDRLAFKREWSSFLHVINVMQFHNAFLFATTNALANDGELYRPLRSQALDQAEINANRDRIDAAWMDILQDEGLDGTDRHAAETFARPENQIPAPVLSFELEDEHGTIVGEATFAWEDHRLAFIPAEYADEDTDNIKAFEQCGWRIMTHEDDVLALFAKLSSEENGKDL